MSVEIIYLGAYTSGVNRAEKEEEAGNFFLRVSGGNADS